MNFQQNLFKQYYNTSMSIMKEFKHLKIYVLFVKHSLNLQQLCCSKQSLSYHCRVLRESATFQKNFKITQRYLKSLA